MSCVYPRGRHSPLLSRGARAGAPAPATRTSTGQAIGRPRCRAASRTSSSTSATASSSRPTSTELTTQARATLDKQAQWLQQYSRYTFTIEGHADERGTREYNIALGARRAQTVRDYLASRGIDPGAHAHDFLRQGAAGRGLQRHFVLVAEPPRRHGAQRKLLSWLRGVGATGAHWAPVVFLRQNPHLESDAMNPRR